MSQHNTHTLQSKRHAHSYNTRSQTRADLMSTSSDQLVKVDFAPTGNIFSKEEENSSCQPSSSKERTSTPQPKTFHPTNPFIDAGAQTSFSNLHSTNPFQRKEIPVIPTANWHPGHKIVQIFNKNHPSLWFATFEFRLKFWKIDEEPMKTDLLLTHLNEDALVSVQDLIFQNPTYSKLKQRLLEKYEPSMSARVSELINPQSLGDNRPSDVLSFLRTNVARADISDCMLKELFLLRMPEEIRLSLCIMHDASLDQLAQAADRMMDAKNAYSSHKVFGNSLENPSANRQHEYLKSKIGVLESKLDSFIDATKNIQGDHFKTFNQPPFFHGPRSGILTNQNVSSKRFCYFHNRFGSRAFKCIPPCSWKNSGNFQNPRR